jgi:hypothetical protein
VEVSYEVGNEPTGFIRGGETLDYLGDCWLLERYYFQCKVINLLGISANEIKVAESKFRTFGQ